MDWSDRIGRRLTPRDLHVFLTVAAHGNMAKAADTLAVSRPVVSKTILDLEQTLGVRLFDRARQGVEPTLYGRALLKRSVVVFDELRQSVEEIRFLADPVAGELRVGCTEPMAAGFVAAIIANLSRRHPRWTFHTEMGSANTLLTTLRERRCELVVARQLADVPDTDINMEALFHEKYFVAVGPRSKWLQRRKVSLAELVDETWILGQLETEPSSPVFEAFRALGLPVPKATVTSNSLNIRNSLLSNRPFITVIPGSALRFGPERSLLKALPIDLPHHRLPIAIMTMKNRTVSPVAELFIKCARELTPLLKRAK